MPDEREPTEEEQEQQATERRREEDAMRGPGHEDPHETIDPDPESGDD